MPQYKLILFDLDGTLLDSAPALVEAANKLLDIYSYPKKKYADLRCYASNGAIALIRAAFEEHGLPDELTKLHQEFIKLYTADILYSVRLFPGMENLIAQINRFQLLWGIVTNKPRKLTEQIITELPNRLNHAVLVCGDDGVKAKPEPDSLLYACQKLNIEPSHSVFIGDHQRDILASNSANMHSIAVGYGYTKNPEDIEQWQATYCAYKVEELNNLLFT